MGCTQSKIDNEEAVSRCRERKQYMKEAVSARNAFAAAHSSYANYLKNTGAALSDFAHGEVRYPYSVTPSGLPNATIPTQPPFAKLPPPPPPLPNFATLQRAASMPEMKIPKPDPKPVGPAIEEEDENELENDGSLNHGPRKRNSRRGGSGSSRGGVREIDDEVVRPPKPPSPPKADTRQPMPPPQQQDSTLEYFFPSMENMPGPTLSEVEQTDLNKQEIDRKEFDDMTRRSENYRGRISEKIEMTEMVTEPEKVLEPDEQQTGSVVASTGKVLKKVKQGQNSADGKRVVKANINLVQVFADLDDHFLKAYESAYEVSKTLEATRLHYHSNFADNRGHMDHSARLMRVITWNRSFRGMGNLDEAKDGFDSEEQETHATILDKLLAWEKKLYDEVKAGELMKIEYERKVSMLTKLKKRATNSEALEKTKAAVNHLHTRYIVDMQSMDSTVAEINRLRDEQLYPKLVQLVDGMATMWGAMREHHESQSKIVTVLSFLDISQSPKETSEHHHERTIQLLVVLQEWKSSFVKLVNHQKDYIKDLNNWLKQNLVPIESSIKETVSSPPRIPNPPIQRLVSNWQDHLDKLPEELARTAISHFAAVVETILHHQQDEMQLKAKCEETRKELERKTRQFEDWCHKHMEQVMMPDEADADRQGDNRNRVLVEKQFMIDSLKKKLEDSEEAYRRQCLQVREKSLASLKNSLPELFRAMSTFALQCSRMYNYLRSLSQTQS